MNWYRQSQYSDYARRYFDDEGLPFSEVNWVYNRLKENMDDLEKNLPDIPGNTCPQIDHIIEIVSDAARSASDIQKLDTEDGDISSLGQDIEWNLSDVPALMEDLREDNSSLRVLGKDWYKQCRDFLEEMGSLIETLRK